MVNWCGTDDTWWLERVAFRECDLKGEDSTSVRRVVWTNDFALPDEVTLIRRFGRAVSWWVLGYIFELLLYSLKIMSDWIAGKVSPITEFLDGLVILKVFSYVFPE